jgi:hypothetical protein
MRRWINTLTQAAILTAFMVALFVWLIALAAPGSLYLPEAM